MAELLLDRLEKRFVKTGLHKASITSFGEIHLETNNDNMVTFLQEVISALPDNQSVLFDAESCYPGFLAWNDFWKDAHAKEDEFNCHNFSNSHTVNKLGTLDSVLECEDCGLRVKENVGHTE